MKRIQILLVIFCLGSLLVKGQNPSLTITPSGTMSVCAGSSVTTTATLSNAFAGTTSYAVSDISFAPYTMLGGTNLTMPDDTVLGVFPIGFQFCFYGNTYTQFYCGSNGWVGFSLGQPRAFTANSIPSASALVPKNCIMGPWMDFHPGIAGGPYIKYQTQGTAPFRRLIVQWTNVPSYLCTSLRNTVQIVIYESTNIIEHFITSKTVCGAWAGGTATQGLHNQTGTLATVVAGRNASVWTATNDGKRFTPNGPPGYTVNWTVNGFPSGTGNTKTTAIPGPGSSRIIARVNFQCSNLILYDTLDVTIGGAASAAFTYTGGNILFPSLICAGQPAAFTYAGGATGTGAWTFTGSTAPAVSGLGTVNSTWNTPGTYPVTLVVTPSSGACSPGTSTQNITVTAPPTSTFTLPASVCVNAAGTITYTGTAAAGSTYSWNFGAGATPATSTGVGPHSVSWSSAGSKSVSLTVTAGSCSSTTTNSITVNTAPTSTFTALPAAVCALANGTITYTGPVVAGATYAWNFGVNATPATASTSGPHTVNWSTAGSKTISLTVTAGGCSSSSTQTVTVNPVPTASFSLPASVCVGANASAAYAGGAAAPPTATYTWSIGGATPAPGNVQGPFNLSWATAGSKTVSLTVTQGGCTSAPASSTITVNPAPVVSVAATPATVCVGQTTSIATTGAAQPAGTTYNWNFGALATPLTSATAGPVSVSWSTVGTKSVSLIVTAGGCSSVAATASVTVTAPPPSAFTIPASACQGAAIAVSAPGPFTGGTTFNWNFAGGTVISGSGAGPYNISWATSGIKAVSLTTSLGGCSSTSTANITIGAGPTATITAPSNGCGNQPTSVSFSGTATGAATYTWNFGAGATPATASTVGPHTVTWSTTGAKTISLTVSDGGCSSSTTRPITINPVYLSTFTIPATVCQGTAGTLTYTGNAPIGSTYAWNFGTGATPATATTVGPHSVTWNTAGAQSTSLSVTSGGCTSTITTQPITVNAAPVVAFTASSPIGVGTPATLTFTGTAIAGASYTWNFGAGATPATASTVGPHSVSWPAAGAKTISLTVSQNGCAATISQVVTVLNAATATFTAPSSVCTGSNAAITYTGNAAPGATYAWGFNGGTIVSGAGAGPYTINWTTAGTKNITLTVTQSGITSPVNTVSVVVNPIPSAAFTIPSPVCAGSPAAFTYSGGSAATATYNWSFGGTPSQATATGQGPQSISWATAGTYLVTLSVSENGCLAPVTTQSVAVQALPSASFSLPPSTCVNAATAVTYSGSAPSSAAYNWNFGAGATPATATGQGPHSVNWSATGTKTVSLTVTQTGCASVPATQPIVASGLPSAAFSLSSPYCVNSPATVTYTGGAGAGATYNWTYTGAALISGSGAGPLQLSWSSGGTKTVSLSVMANGCASSPVSNTTLINSPPVFTVSSPAYSGVNTSTAITYSGAQPAGATYTWNFNGGTVISGSGAGPYDVQWATTGVKSISCTVTIAGCSPTVQTTSTEIVAGAAVTFTAQSPVCINSASAVVFTGFAVASATYTWNFSGGTIISGSGASPYQVSWQTSGAKTVTLDVTQFGITTSSSQTVTVNTPPTSDFSVPSVACSGREATISYTGSAGAGSTFNWNFGSGLLTSGAPGAINQVEFPTAGTFPVTLTVIENACTSAVTTHDITIRQTPSAAFTTDANVCEGTTSTVQLNTPVGSGASFLWNYGSATYVDGSAGGPIHVLFETPGANSISLLVTENQCVSDTFFVQTQVNANPVATFTVQSNSCSTDTVAVTFTGTASPTASFSWNFGTATVLSGNNSGPYQLTFAAGGVYPVSLTITDNGCISQAVTNQVALNNAPGNAFILADTTYAGVAANAQYSGSAPAGTTFTWEYPGADWISGSGPGPLQLNWPTPGTYQVTLALNNNGCAPSPVTHGIVVLPFPSSAFSISQDTICAASPVIVAFDGATVNGATYIWDFDGGSGITGSGAGPYTLSWSTPGWKTISLLLSMNGTTSATSTAQVLVIEVPQADFSLALNACTGQTVSAGYLNSANVSAQFQWTYDGATASGTSSGLPDFNWAIPGQKIVTLSVADAMCISDVVAKTIQVHEIPTALFILPAYACKDAGVIVTYTGAQLPGATYNWNFAGAGVQSGTNEGPYEVNWSSTGTKHITLTVSSNGCTSAPADSVLLVKGLPSADAGEDKLLCSGDTIQLSGVQSPSYSYRWFPGGGMNSDTIADPLLSLQTIHNYVDTVAYRLTVSDGYCSATDSTSVSIAPKPEAGFTVPSPQCFNENSFNFEAGGSFTEDAGFSWDFGPHAYSHSPNEQNQPGIHFETTGYQPVSLIITQFGCVSGVYRDSVLVNRHPQANYTAENVKGCVPLLTNFYGTSSSPNSTFIWAYGDGGEGFAQDEFHTYVRSGYMTVTLTVSDSTGCSGAYRIENYVQVLEQPIAGFIPTPDLLYIGGEELQLISTSQNALYSYYVIQGDTILGSMNTYSFKEEGIYPITQVVVNGAGCSDYVTHMVRVQYGSSYYFPSAFTPNSDGKNDQFLIQASNIYEFRLVIYDRWGHEVFSTTNINEGWDGTTNDGNHPMPEGVYIFRLELRTSTAHEVIENGQFTLLR